MADLRSILQPILSRRGRHWHAAEVPVGVWKHGVAVPAVAKTGLQVWALGASWDLPVMPTTCNCDGATGLHNVTKQLHNGMYLSVRMQSTAAALSTNVESLLSRSEKTYNGTSKPVTTVSLKTASQCLTSSDLRTHKKHDARRRMPATTRSVPCGSQNRRAKTDCLESENPGKDAWWQYFLPYS